MFHLKVSYSMQNDKSKAPPASNPDGKTNGEANAVWSFRGYTLRPSDFTTAMVHLFRAEITRANVWRTRLDATTNWAVISTGAGITIAFSPGGHPSVFLLNSLLITLFLFIEARRYRYYELWSSRVRLMETDFFGAMLVPPFKPSGDWAESLSHNLLQPKFPISMWEAFGRRYRRNYLWIYLILGIAWVADIWLLPPVASSFQEFLTNASVGGVHGSIVLGAGVLFNGLLLLVGLLTTRLHEASGEVFPRYPGLGKAIPADEKPATRRFPWFRPSGQRQQLLALIITDHPENVSQYILKEMRRGVTALKGTGMYTGEQHAVLISALTVTEAAHLKSLVNEIDPDAFVIVSPAQEILGRGFKPLEEIDH